MKRLITVLCGFMTLITFAQDKEYLFKLREGVRTQEEVIQLTNEILVANPNLKMYGAQLYDKDDMFVVRYAPTYKSDDEIKWDADNNNADEYIIFQIRAYLDKATYQNQKPTERTYYLDHVRGNFENIFPYWVNKFDKEANKEKIKQKKYKHIEDIGTISYTRNKWYVEK